MTRLLANFDADGRLVCLHLNPVEECNLDDADNVKQMGWVAGLVGLSTRAKDADASIRTLLCQHCDFGEDA